ncbi:MAG: cupin domain-containing protein [Spirochaetia bacterium]|nr:cupin domain-containing protein [Spirochaetia bacterium]
MIKRIGDMEKEVRERMRGGTGSVEFLHIFRREELKGKVRLLARLRLSPGSSIGYHEHEGEEEVFYILSGTGTVTEQGVTSTVGPGDAVLTAAGGGHSIENQGTEPLEFIAAILLY